MKISSVVIPSSGATPTGELNGVLAVPEGHGPFPGVVMVHEAFGIEENMRAQIDRMCSAGYIVLMPDLYSRGGLRKCLTATFRALSEGKGQAFEDVEAAKRFLLDRSDCSGKIGILGFCMGGGFALQMASHGFAASAVNYGIMPKDLDAALEGACPIVGSYGGKDRSVRNGAAVMEAALTRKGIPHDVKSYPDASHAFMNPGYVRSRVWGPLQRVTGFAPRPDDARDAWARIEKFFAKYLA